MKKSIILGLMSLIFLLPLVSGLGLIKYYDADPMYIPLSEAGETQYYNFKVQNNADNVVEIILGVKSDLTIASLNAYRYEIPVRSSTEFTIQIDIPSYNYQVGDYFIVEYQVIAEGGDNPDGTGVGLKVGYGDSVTVILGEEGQEKIRRMTSLPSTGDGETGSSGSSGSGGYIDDGGGDWIIEETENKTEVDIEPKTETIPEPKPDNRDQKITIGSEDEDDNVTETAQEGVPITGEMTEKEAGFPMIWVYLIGVAIFFVCIGLYLRHTISWGKM